MMRRLSYLLLLLLLAACARELDSLQEWAGPVIQLELNLEDAAPTKADDNVYEQPGDNIYHENELKWVDFFFYPGGATSSNATLHKREELEQLTRNSAVFRLNLTTNDVNYSIFPVLEDIEDATVLALVNVSKDVLDGLDDTSLDNLLSLSFTTDFEAKTATENHRQSSFMMSGQTVLHLDENGGRTRKVVSQGSIPIKRYAAKITVGIKVDDFKEIPTNILDENDTYLSEIWTPCVTEMKIYIQDAIKTVTLSGEPYDTSNGFPVEGDKLTSKNNALLFFENLGTEAVPIYEQIFGQSTGGYYNTFPTYVYPQRWADGLEGEPYLKLVLPWERAEVKNSQGMDLIKYAKKDFYYKILIPKDIRGGDFVNTFTRNNWYHYNIKVSMLGADTDDAIVALEPVDVFVCYWQDKNMVVKQADIGNARYLSLNQHMDNNTYVLHNETTYPIGFTTSHPVTLEILGATRPFYGKVPTDNGEKVGDTLLGGTLCQETSESGKKSYYLDYLEKARSEKWFEVDGGYVVMNHPLVNDYHEAAFDYAPYTLSFAIYHSDKHIDSDFSQTVTVLQYPGIFITFEENSDPRVTDPAQGLPISGDENENASGAVWRNFANNGYVFEDGARRMRHKTEKNDDGEYGTLARILKPTGAITDTYDDTYYRLEWLQWRTVHFSGGNRDRYTINVSVLPSDDYIIGDPRTLEPETWNNGMEDRSPNAKSGVYYFNWVDADGDGEVDEEEKDFNYVAQFQPGPDIRTYQLDPENKRLLQDYYPADETDRTKNMLAPALRVASRFGGVEYGRISRRSARFKCATYQEDGYPAGRWRLPTRAEIDFIKTLTQSGSFVRLFSASLNYWSANGAVGSTASSTTKDALVRCVYDAWYWDAFEDRLPPSDRNTYVLGDLPR